jgi:site-specific recombinase XerC
VKVADVVLDDSSACIHLRGKGRKQRSVPLWRSTVKAVRAWLRINPEFQPTSSLLPNRNGHAMTRANVALRLTLAARNAAHSSPGLAERHVSPHTIRHYLPFRTMSGNPEIAWISRAIQAFGWR